MNSSVKLESVKIEESINNNPWRPRTAHVRAQPSKWSDSYILRNWIKSVQDFFILKVNPSKSDETLKVEASHDLFEDLSGELAIDDHVKSEEEVLENYRSSLSSGLSSSEALRRLMECGPNSVVETEKVPEFIKFLSHFCSSFSLLLISGSVISFIGYAIDAAKDRANLYIGIALFVVVSITNLFSYLQERSSNSIVQSFKNYIPNRAKVLRDGKWTFILVENLVPGDIVEIEKGNLIPADLRILDCRGLKVDNSTLTGEVEPQPRSIKPEAPNSNPLEARNMCFGGTMVIEGTGIGVVVMTGSQTVFGNIACLVSKAKSLPTPISREISYFIKRITAIAMVIGIAFFALSVFLKNGVIYSLVLMIGIIVANVPEGLLATITVALSITAKRMASRKALVKNLEAVETLGSTSVICTDKTGTLTLNQMTVSKVWFDDQTVAYDESRAFPFTLEQRDSSFSDLFKIAALCNRAVFATVEEKTEILGDASESALLRFCERFQSVAEYRGGYETIAEVPFNSYLKFQVSVHVSTKNDEGSFIALKGAPERILQMCSSIQINGQIIPLSSDWMEKLEKCCEEMGSSGNRVLGFAIKSKDFPLNMSNDELLCSVKENGERDFTFVGLFGLIDPPREGVREAVLTCKRAGIKVIMVTGDHPSTARAIAKEVAIISDEDQESIVITGSEISHFNKEDWDRVLLGHKEIVFARTSPQQKLIIVEQNQMRGAVVAVTGDGVNDSAALKQADIGIAMGIMGSDVSKEAANMILLDDNFGTIVNGIEEGRKIFDNLKKSIAYTLTSNIPELMPFLLFAVFGLPLPLTTILILCIDLGTDMVPAISLAHEPPEADIMNRAPRRIGKDRLVSPKLLFFSYLQIGVIQFVAAMCGYFYVMNAEGFKPASLFFSASAFADHQSLFMGKTFGERMDTLARAQTLYFVIIVMVQWADLLISKTSKASIFSRSCLFNNRQVWIGLAFETALAILIVYCPGFDMLFGTRPLPLSYMWIGLPFVLYLFIYDELRKWCIRTWPTGLVSKITLF